MGRGLQQPLEGCGAMDRLPVAPAKIVMKGVARDSAEPGFQAGRLPQLPQLLPRAQKDVLTHILALRDAARGTIGHRANQRLIPLHDLSEGLALSGHAARDEIGIGWLGGRHEWDGHLPLKRPAARKGDKVRPIAVLKGPRPPWRKRGVKYVGAIRRCSFCARVGRGRSLAP